MEQLTDVGFEILEKDNFYQERKHIVERIAFGFDSLLFFRRFLPFIFSDIFICIFLFRVQS